MTRTVAIVQARMGSTRLPGKVLRPIGSATMLARVVRRLGRARRIDELVVATTDAAADDAVVAEARALGAAVFRGSEDDVLDRYARAARAYRAEVVVRVTSDCPLVDPEVVDRVIGAREHDEADYASNSLRRTYPRGLDAEALRAESLECAWSEAREPYERAHVTAFLYRRPERFRLRSVEADGDFGAHRWTVDAPEDLDLACAIYAALGDRDDFDWRDALAVVEARPDLAALNRHVRQKALEEG